MIGRKSTNTSLCFNGESCFRKSRKTCTVPRRVLGYVCGGEAELSTDSADLSSAQWERRPTWLSSLECSSDLK